LQRDRREGELNASGSKRGGEGVTSKPPSLAREKTRKRLGGSIKEKREKFGRKCGGHNAKNNHHVQLSEGWEKEIGLTNEEKKRNKRNKIVRGE